MVQRTSPETERPTAVMELEEEHRLIDHTLERLFAQRQSCCRVVHSRRAVAAISAHDAAETAALSSALSELPGGQTIADELLREAGSRREILQELLQVTSGVNPLDVYPVANERFERLVRGLADSFRQHEQYAAEVVMVALEHNRAAPAVEELPHKLAHAYRWGPNEPHSKWLTGHGGPVARTAMRLGDWLKEFRDMATGPRAGE